MPNADPFDLARFLSAQDPVYEGVLTELRRGRKRSHWMWFIFPQIDGLGFSSTTRYFSIKSEPEARAYLAHAVLGPRLAQCVETILSLEARPAGQIFGPIDEMKLKSSMTLFAHVAGPDSAFVRVLARYFDGKADRRTLELLIDADASGGDT